MNYKNVKERFIDKESGIEYVKQDDYYMPNISFSANKKIKHLGKTVK